MRKFALLLLAGLAVPAFAASDFRMDEKVTVAQLELILARNHGQHDEYLERLLRGLELTERLSAKWLAHAEAELPGPASRKALMGICDEAAFLNLPSRDLPAIAPMDHAAQLSLLTLAVGYVNQTTHELPNFFATRETINFETKLWAQDVHPEHSLTRELLSSVGTSNVTVFYRDGREFKQNKAGKEVKDDPSEYKLETNGEFGPILATVLSDALHGRMTWGHWEQGPSALIAVFRYSVAKESSHYSVFYPGFLRNKQEFPAYHGEIAVNPADGSILRITVQADFDPSDQNVRADLLVEYGSVEIGNKNYICPVKSVALSMVRIPSPDFALRNHDYDNASFFQMRVNNVRFTHYHLFRAETRILTGDDAAVVGPSPSPSPEGMPAKEPAKVPQP
jgi:hypothetical protein